MVEVSPLAVGSGGLSGCGGSSKNERGGDESPYGLQSSRKTHLDSCA